MKITPLGDTYMYVYYVCEHQFHIIVQGQDGFNGEKGEKGFAGPIGMNGKIVSKTILKVYENTIPSHYECVLASHLCTRAKKAQLEIQVLLDSLEILDPKEKRHI